MEFGETAADALAREMREKREAVAEVKQLCFAGENYFRWRGRRAHELLFFHAMEFSDEVLTAERFMGREGEILVEFKMDRSEGGIRHGLSVVPASGARSPAPASGACDPAHLMDSAYVRG